MAQIPRTIANPLITYLVLRHCCQNTKCLLPKVQISPSPPVLLTWQLSTTLSPKSAVTLLMQPEKAGGESTHVLYERNSGMSDVAGDGSSATAASATAVSRVVRQSPPGQLLHLPLPLCLRCPSSVSPSLGLAPPPPPNRPSRLSSSVTPMFDKGILAAWDCAFRSSLDSSSAGLWAPVWGRGRLKNLRRLSVFPLLSPAQSSSLKLRSLISFPLLSLATPTARDVPRVTDRAQCSNCLLARSEPSAAPPRPPFSPAELRGCCASTGWKRDRSFSLHATYAWQLLPLPRELSFYAPR